MCPWLTTPRENHSQVDSYLWTKNSYVGIIRSGSTQALVVFLQASSRYNGGEREQSGMGVSGGLCLKICISYQSPEMPSTPPLPHIPLEEALGIRVGPKAVHAALSREKGGQEQRGEGQ